MEVLQAVVGKIIACPPKMDPTEQYKKKFRLRIKQKAPGLPGFDTSVSDANFSIM